MNKISESAIHEAISKVIDLPCWHVACGGAVGSSFQLAFGGKVPREFPLSNQHVHEDYRIHDGEFNLLVWCTWRLETKQNVLTSSDDRDTAICEQLKKLTGVSITDIEIDPPAWDCTLHFSNDQQLKIFCDHVPGEPSFDGNWEFISQSIKIYFGPGAKVELIDCS